MNWIKKGAAFIAAIAMSATAWAADTVIELDETYDFGFSYLTATITIPYDGDLYVDGTLGLALDGVYPDTQNGSYGTKGQLGWYLGVTAGEHKLEGWVQQEFMFYMLADELKMTGCNPEQDTVLSPNVNATGDIIITFNQPVTYSSAYIMNLSSESISMSSNIAGNAVALARTSVNIQTAMKEMYASGKLKEEGGENIAVVLNNVVGASGDKLSQVMLTYVSATKLMELESTTAVDGSYFLSYYTQDDPDGIISFTFDKPINTTIKPVASIGIGNLENDGEYYYEELPVAVDGYTATIDFTGKNRRPLIAACGDFNGTDLSFKLTNVYDENGQLANSTQQGNVGSFSVTFVYKEIPESPIDFSFNPANGESLAGVSQLTLWHNNLSVIQQMDGLQFTYADGTTYLIPAADLDNTADVDDEAKYTVAVPERAKTEAVTVELAGIVASDGYDKYIRAQYNQLVITTCYKWITGESYATLENGTEFMVELNYAYDYPQMAAAWRIDRVNNDGSYYTVATGDFTRNKWDEFETVYNGADVTFERGYNYIFTVTTSNGYEGEASIPFVGSGDIFNYSSYLLESITPNPADGPLEADHVTVTYDGFVTILGNYSGVVNADGTLTPFKQLVAEVISDDADFDGYSTKWSLYLPDMLREASMMTIRVCAADFSGATIEGDLASRDASDANIFTYDIDAIDSGIQCITIVSTELDADAPVYSLDGRMVTTRPLPAGIYVQQGVKRIVR